ncbi:MAG: MmgE/PrpD family protein, partial [Deltaproteobacteria bacterium]|nr:MmgE/PrpD family protein [Deltaproteobacteria bacterium]
LKNQMKDALSAAATGAAGILKVIRGHSELKAFNAGQAAATGLTAVLMSQAGFCGPDDVLGGKEGFLSILADTFDSALLLSRRNDLWGIERIYVKPYAACRHCHAPVEAALSIRSRESFLIDEVAKVDVKTHRWAVYLHDHTEIEGLLAAKMSIPYSVAVALETGRAGLAEFVPERVREPGTLQLTKKVHVEASDELTSLVPDKRAAIVEVTLYDGCRFVERVDVPKGEPENPLHDDELEEKSAKLLCLAGKTQKEASKIIESVWNVETEIKSLYSRINA